MILRNLNSLRTRLLIVFMLIVLVTIAAVAIFALQTAGDAFRRSIGQQARTNQELTSAIFSAYQHHNTQQVQQLIEQDATLTHTHIILIDKQQHVVADSSQQLTGQVLTLTDILTLEGHHILPSTDTSSSSANAPSHPSYHTIPIRIISTSMTDMTLGDVPIGLGFPPEASFTSMITASLWPTVVVASLVALFATLLLSSTILKPIAVLTEVARRMEQGDLSQRVHINTHDEIGKLAHAFNTMAESLERAEQLRRNMVSDVAHELRTPLTNIRGYLEAILDGLMEPTIAAITSIYEEALLLSRLVADLQDLSLAEAGQLKLECMPVALEDIVSKAVNGLSIQAEKKQLTLQTFIPADLPPVEADAERVGQILRNLINNAIMHTPEGGRIEVCARATTQEVEVRVCDTGEGIAPEHLPHLFKRFYRVDRSRTRATGGTGLGLAIVDQLVQAHGGHISVQSQPGQGTCFTFTLPKALP